MRRFLSAIYFGSTLSLPANAALIEIDVSALTFENDRAIPSIAPYGLSGDLTLLFDTDTRIVSDVAMSSPSTDYIAGTFDDVFGRFRLTGVGMRKIDIDTDWTIQELEALTVSVSDCRFPVGDEADLGIGGYFAFITDRGVTATRLPDPVPPAIPLPASWPLALSCLAILGGLRRRSRA